MSKNKKDIADKLIGKKHGVYNIIGIPNENKIKIKPIGNIRFEKETDSVKDELIDRFQIRKSTFGEIYKCNIIDEYLISKNSQPMYSLRVVYEKMMFCSMMFNVILKFNIEDKIESENELLTKEINGKYSFELNSPEGTDVLTKLSERYNETGFVGKAKTIEFMKEFIMSEDALEMILKMSIDKEKERNEQMKKTLGEFDFDVSIPKATFSYKEYFENENKNTTKNKKKSANSSC